MGFPRISKDFINYTVLAATSEDGDFVKENIKDYLHPTIPARTTGTAESVYELDLVAVRTNITVLLDWVNYNTITWEESPDGIGSWVSVGTGLTVKATDVHGIYRGIYDLTLSSKQYLRLKIPSQTPVDNATKFRTGGIGIVNTVDILPDGFLQDINYTLVDNSFANQFGDRTQKKFKRNSEMQLLINLSYNVNGLQNLLGTELNQFAQITKDPTQAVLIDINDSDNSQAFIGLFSGDITVGLDGTGRAKYASRIFEVAY